MLYLEVNRRQNCWFTNGINCLFKLAAYVKEKTSEKDQSLMLK
jgi:hypothetical protein